MLARRFYEATSEDNVERLDSQPDGVDADHLSSSRSQPAHCADAAKGQVTFKANAPRRSSIRMSSTTGVTAGLHRLARLD